MHPVLLKHEFQTWKLSFLPHPVVFGSNFAYNIIGLIVNMEAGMKSYPIIPLLSKSLVEESCLLYQSFINQQSFWFYEPFKKFCLNDSFCQLRIEALYCGSRHFWGMPGYTIKSMLLLNECLEYRGSTRECAGSGTVYPGQGNACWRCLRCDMRPRFHLRSNGAIIIRFA